MPEMVDSKLNEFQGNEAERQRLKRQKENTFNDIFFNDI